MASRNRGARDRISALRESDARVSGRSGRQSIKHRPRSNTKQTRRLIGSLRDSLWNFVDELPEDITMSNDKITRREFIEKTTLTVASATVLPSLLESEAEAKTNLPQRVLGRTGAKVPVIAFG